MGEDRPLRHRVLQHHVNLRCDSAGCPPPAHLTWSAMTPGATLTECLRAHRSRCCRARPASAALTGTGRGLACLPGGAGPGRCPLAGAGMRTWQDGITGSLLPGIGPRQAHLPPDCGRERAGGAVRAACIASRPIGVTLSSSYRKPS